MFMDKYFSPDAQFPSLAVHDFFPVMHEFLLFQYMTSFPQCLNSFSCNAWTLLCVALIFLSFYSWLLFRDSWINFSWNARLFSGMHEILRKPESLFCDTCITSLGMQDTSMRHGFFFLQCMTFFVSMHDCLIGHFMTSFFVMHDIFRDAWIPSLPMHNYLLVIPVISP